MMKQKTYIQLSLFNESDYNIKHDHSSTQTQINIIFIHVGSIRPLKNKLYYDETKNLHTAQPFQRIRL